MVDFIILEGATGDAYRYGLFFAETREVNQPGEGDEPGKVSYVRTLRFESPKWSSDFDNRVGYIGDNGVPGGVAVDGDGKLRFRVTWRLWRACPQRLLRQQRRSYVNAGGKVYQVSNKVVCYNTTTKVWFTGDDPLYQIRAYSDDLTIYVDPYGEKVRVITPQ